MISHLRKRVAPAFLAAAMAFSSLGYSQQIDPDKPAEPPAPAAAPDNQPPPGQPPQGMMMFMQAPERPLQIYDMDFEELVTMTRGDVGTAWGIYEFYQLRRIRLDKGIDQASVNEVIAKMEILNRIDPDKTIEISIHSPGGSLIDTLRLCDKMRDISNPIRTVCDNIALSGGAIILIAGDERVITPTGRVMIHEASGGAGGKVSEREMQIMYSNGSQDQMFQLIADNTGLSLEAVRVLCREDVFYDAKDALRLGFVDRIDETAGKPQRKLAGTRELPTDLIPKNLPLEYFLKLEKERSTNQTPGAQERPAPHPAPTIN